MEFLEIVGSIDVQFFVGCFLGVLTAAWLDIL